MTAPVQYLNSEQLAAVQHRGSDLLIAAGAGTGKTHTLAHRCASLIADGIRPHQLVVLAFTNAAADEIKARVSGLISDGDLITAGTFHSMAHRLLRRHGSRIGLDGFTVMDSAEAESLLSLLRREMRVDIPAEVKTRRILELISYESNTGASLESLCAASFSLQPHTGAVLALQEAFFGYKRANACLDYDDLLFSLQELFQAVPEIVSEYRHVLVDEFQDTNALQLSLLRQLSAAGACITVVGDPCQSIYAFRGAVPSVMQDFSHGREVIVLRRNYRSPQPVLDYANRVIQACPGLIRKDLLSDLPGSSPTVKACPSEQDEAKQVARSIRALLDKGVPPDRIAALYSSSRHSAVLQMELTSHGIPYITRGGLRLHETAHVRDMLALLRLSLNATDNLSLRRVLLLIPGLGAKTAARITDPFFALVPAKAITRHAELVETLRKMSTSSPADAWAAALAWYQPLIHKPHHRHELEDVGTSLSGCSSLRRWLDDMALDSAAQEDGKGKVCLSTVHSAKGKEWDHVFVLGLAEGRFTRASSGSPEYHEAVRLFYVAVTRARRSLTITVPLFCRMYDGSFRHVRSSSLLP